MFGRYRFGNLDADIAAAERDVMTFAEAHALAVTNAHAVDGSCTDPNGVPLPNLICDGSLVTAMDDSARRLGDANERLAKLQQEKGDAEAAQKARAARAEALLAAEEAREAARSKNVARARAAGARAKSAARSSQAAAGGSWFQTAPMEQKLAVFGIVFGALLVLIFAIKAG